MTTLAVFDARAQAALAHWELPPQRPALLGYRENAVYEVRLADGGKAALRLHRPGHYDRVALEAELAFTAHLARNGIRAPVPVATRDGAVLVELDGDAAGQFADLIGWVDGEPLGRAGVPLRHDRTALERIFAELGGQAARIHALADAWAGSPAFRRPAWDADGLVGETPLWGRFWQGAGLPGDVAARLCGLCARLRRHLDALTPSLDRGLIHADLVRENVLVGANGLSLIDFNDCGFGYRLFELATVLVRNRCEGEYPAIREALLAGYLAERPAMARELAHLDLFMLLRGLTYIGWVLESPTLPDAAERLGRYLADAETLARAYEGSAA